MQLLRELVAAINRSSDVMERLAAALEAQTEVEKHYLVKTASN
jgi:hypothetical protein